MKCTKSLAPIAVTSFFVFYCECYFTGYLSKNKKDMADSGIKLLNKKTPQNWRVFILRSFGKLRDNLNICNTQV
ncbi:MAG: hypothetical protein DI529_08995 [Chryseobacterium sp.]|nr:MAG: hypothetical protein DI529_08995 [Chryseobacterium sp.]